MFANPASTVRFAPLPDHVLADQIMAGAVRFLIVRNFPKSGVALECHGCVLTGLKVVKQIETHNNCQQCLFSVKMDEVTMGSFVPSEVQYIGMMLRVHFHMLHVLPVLE